MLACGRRAGGPTETGPGIADLELAAEVDGGDYEARVVAHAGRRPFVHVQNRRAGALSHVHELMTAMDLPPM